MVSEGSNHTYSFTTSDVDTGDTFVLGATVCGSGGNQVGADTFNPATGAGSFVCEFPDGPATPTVSVTVSDDDGGSDSDTVDVIVSNVAPIVTLTGDATVDEGESRTYSFTVSDPGADTFVLGATVCGSGGNQVGTDTFNPATGAGSFVCEFPDGPATPTVSVTVSDDDGGSDSDTVDVIVSNVAPIVTLTGDATVDEGESRTYSFTVSDPGADTFVLGATVCGSGGNQVGADTFNPATGAGSFVCEFPDGPATPTVSVTVSDDDGGSDSDTVDVIVSNVAPIVTLTGDATVDEGESRTYSFTVSDPGADTFVLGATVCGSGGNQVGTDTFNPATGAGSFVCEFPDGPATPTVSVTVSDDDGGSDSDTVDVIVSNVAPIVTLTGDATVDEGESRTYSFTVSDPGADTFVLGATVCGSGGNQVGADTFDPATGAGSFVCEFPDGPATPTVSVTVSDDDGGSDSDTVDVIVSNVAPIVTLTGDATVDEGESQDLQLHRQRSGADTFVLGATVCGSGGNQVGTDTFNTGHRRRQLRLRVPRRPGHADRQRDRQRRRRRVRQRHGRR